MPPTESGSSTSSRWKLLLLVGTLIAIFIAARFFRIQDHLKQILESVSTLGHWGPILFVTLYILASIFFIPGSVLTLGAGAIFGVFWGSVYVSVGSTLGATAAFLVGRYFARGAISRKIDGNPRFAAIDKAVAVDGWKIVGLTRLSPVFPFTLLNYAFGITRVSLRDYIVASWIGMMPGTVMYVYLGSLAQAATGQRSRTTAEWVLYGIGLFATVLVTIYVTRLARRALNARILTEQ